MLKIQKLRRILSAQLGTELPSANKNLIKFNKLMYGGFDGLYDSSNFQLLGYTPNSGPVSRLLYINPNNPPVVEKQQEEKVKQKAWQEKLDKLQQDPKNQKVRNLYQGATDVIDTVGGAFGSALSATNSKLTNTLDTTYDGVADAVGNLGPFGKVLGGAMKTLGALGDISLSFGGGTDQLTTTDKWMDSSFFSWNIGMLNGFAGKNSDNFSADLEILAKAGGSYGGSADTITDAADKSGKKYGLFSYKSRREANDNIAKAKAIQNKLGNITNTAEDLRLAAASMGEQAGLAYSLMADGGYNLKYTYSAKQGGILKSELLEWEPQIELNWELENKEEFLEWVPNFQTGGEIKSRTIEELINYAKLKNPRFIQRLSEEPKGIKFIDDEGNEVEGSHYLESRGKYVIPRILEINGELKFLNPQEAIDKAIESGNYLEMTPEEAILFAEKYKQGWPDFFKKFKKGGSVEASDIPKKEETAQKNVIPEGALHKNKHHMEHAEGLTKKGIPVIDNDGELQAEVEKEEIVFTLEVTKKLEDFYKIFYSEDSTNKEKEEAAFQAGKLLVYEILENTDDRAGLIESCKLGGTLTMKKPIDVELTSKKDIQKDLIKEAIKEVILELIK